MSRKYLAFLGTNRYEECCYVINGQAQPACRFVQEALTAVFCREWTAADRILIFTTTDAKRKNWESSADWVGLQERLHALNLPCPHDPLDIPDGDSEAALWQIFEIVFGQLHEGDEIIFDITHAFRSLPLLAVIILNYARFVKNCTLAGMYYGAFEVLGPIQEVKKMPVADRCAPVFDLTPFASLLDWTIGIDRFLYTGDASLVIDLTTRNIRPILSATQGQHVHANQLRNLAKAMGTFSQNVATCRGKELSASALTLQQQLVQAILSSQQLIKPLQPLLQKLQERFQPYQTDQELLNLFAVVKWCREHHLIQQGLTLLEESLMSGICVKLGLDADNLELRHAVSGGIAILAQKLNEHDTEFEQNMPFTLAQLRGVLPSRNFIKAFERLRSMRNDINHGGYQRDYKKAQEFEKAFDALLHDFEQDIQALV